MENGKRAFSEEAGNWLKGTLVRAYTAQWEHFLELHARRGGGLPQGGPGKKRPVAPETAAVPPGEGTTPLLPDR